MFQGLHHCLMDDKGRIAFPAPLRTALVAMASGEGKPRSSSSKQSQQQDEGLERFILTQSLYEPCLVAMTERDFQAQAEKVRQLPPSNPAVMQFKRFVIAPATVAVVDRAGRISVPKELREYAGLERESVWAGVVERIELWSKQRWDELLRAQAPDDRERTREYLERHGL